MTLDKKIRGLVLVVSAYLIGCTSAETLPRADTLVLTPASAELIFSPPLTVIEEIQVEARDIAMTSTGAIWILSGRNLLHLEQGHSATFTTPYVFEHLSLAPDDTVWGYNAEHLARFDGTNWLGFALPQGSEQLRIAYIAVASDSRVWVELMRKEPPYRPRLMVFDTHTWQPVDVQSPRQDGYFAFVGLDNHGRPWISWHAAAAYLDNDQWVIVNENIGGPRFAPDGSWWATVWGAWNEELPNRGPSASRDWVDTTIGQCYHPASGVEQCYPYGPIITRTLSAHEPLGVFAWSFPSSAQIEANSPMMGHDLQRATIGSDSVLWGTTIAIDKSDYDRLGFSELDQSVMQGVSLNDELVCFVDNQWTAYSIGNKGREIRHILAAPDRTLWIATERSLFQIQVPAEDCRASYP